MIILINSLLAKYKCARNNSDETIALYMRVTEAGGTKADIVIDSTRHISFVLIKLSVGVVRYNG
jgi:hypothetical protein